MAEYQVRVKVSVGILFSRNFEDVVIYEADSGSEAIKMARAEYAQKMRSMGEDPEDYPLQVIDVKRI